MRLIGRLKFACLAYSNGRAATIRSQPPQIKLIRSKSTAAAAAVHSQPSDLVKLRPKVVFFGTDLLSIRILKGLHQLLKSDQILGIKAVTSVNPSAKNESATSLRGNRIIDYCTQNSIDYHLWSDLRTKKSTNYDNQFASYDVGVVASFGHLIPSALIELFP